METTITNGSTQSLRNLATSALKTTSEKIMAAAPNSGRLSDAAISVASAVENAATSVANLDVKKFAVALPLLRKMPWRMVAAGAVIFAGSAYLIRELRR